MSLDKVHFAEDHNAISNCQAIRYGAWNACAVAPSPTDGFGDQKGRLTPPLNAV
jgi:hypothetical protein